MRTARKILLSLLLIGTFTAYVFFTQINGSQNVILPIAIDQKPRPLQAPTPTPPTEPTSTPSQSPSVDAQAQLQAQGTVRITSSYSSDITLVRTTRLLTPDGRLFRLAQTVLLPADGQVRIPVYADQNGSVYAIGPTTFTIPGLPSDLQQYFSVVSEATFVMAPPMTISTNTSVVITPPAAASTIAPVAPPPVNNPTPAPSIRPQGLYKDGTYTGTPADAYYGTVQVEAFIQNEQISDVRFLDHPQDRNRSVQINDRAMPILTSEAIQAQNANVDIVSGATDTSLAFRQSLASALAQAKN